MNAQQYNNLKAPLEKHPQAANFIVRANKIITYLYYVAYPVLLVFLFVQGNAFVWHALLFPALGFLLVTALRAAINKPRPYESLDIEPLIHKDTKGKSFPSRHAYSAMAIAVTFFLVNAAVGIPLIVLALCMAVVRVMGGVHYPSDVAAGAALGVLFATLEVLV